MATTVEPHGTAQPYVDADEYIDFQLAKTQSQIKTTEILTSASWLGIAALSYVLTFVVLDQWVIPGGFGFWARAIWLGLLVAGGGAWLVWRIMMPWFRTIHELYAAKMIESADPTLKSSLLNLIDLQLHGREGQSSVVRTSMEKRAAVELSRVDVDQAVNHRSLLRLAYSLLAVIVVCSLYVMFSPKDAFSSVQRLLLPSSRTSVATRTTIANVSPEDKKALTGELLTVEADILGHAPQQVTLLYTTEDREFVNQPVEMQRIEEGISRFRGVISGEKGRGLMQNMSYRIEAGDARTREYQVQVVEPPSSKAESVAYTFPAYMKLDPKTLSGGHIDAWEGTKVVVTARTNIPVQSALLVMTDSESPQAKGEEIRMTVQDGQQLTAEWPLAFRTDGTFARYYHIDCTTATGESDPQPTVYAIKIQPDQRPDVALIYPTQDIERPANATVPLLVKASDPDFQLRFITLRVAKADEEIHSASLLDEERQTFEGTHDLQLDQLGVDGLKPGDEVVYWIEARDNKQPHGNRQTTPRLKIKITAPAQPGEVAQQLEKDRLQQKEQLAQADTDRNPNEQNPKPDEPQNQENRPPQPPNANENKKPEEKPGQPMPREKPEPSDNANNSDDAKPNEQRPDKPEADPQQQRGKSDKNRPMRGNNDKQQRQPGDKGAGEEKPGEKNPNEPGDKPEPGEKNNKPEGENEKSSNGNDGATKSPKKGPADDQTALSKLLERQQQDPESNPEQPPPAENNNSKEQQNQTGEQKQPNQQQPNQQRQPADSPMPSNEKKSTGNDQNSDSESSQEKSRGPQSKSNTGKDSSESKSQQNRDKSKTEDGTKQENQPDPKQDKTAANKNRDDQSKSSDQNKTGQDTNAQEKSAEQKSSNDQMKKDATSKRDTGKSNPSSDSNDRTKSEKRDSNSTAEKSDPNSTQKKKKPDSNDSAEGEKSKTDGNQPDTPKNKKSDDNADQDPNANSAEKKATEKMATEKMADDRNDSNGQPGKSPQNSADKADESAQEKSAAPKANGTGKKPTNEPAPENADTTKGQGNGMKPTPKSDKAEKKNQPDSEPSPNGPGEETPAESDPHAEKKKADGNEKGPAEGEQNPSSDKPARAKNDVERKPQSKEGAMRKSDEPRDPGTKAERSSKDPDATKTKPDGSTRPDEQKAGTNKNSNQPREKRPGNEATQDEPNPGKGRPEQKSQKADSGEAGGNTPQDNGTSGSKQKGTGDTQPQPGNQTPDKKNQGGEPGKTAGEGTTKRATEKKSDSPTDGTTPMKDEAGKDTADQNGTDKKDAESSEKSDSSEPMPGEKNSSSGQPMNGKAGDKGGQPKEGAGQPNQPGQKSKGGPSSKPSQGGKGAGGGGSTPGEGSPGQRGPEDNQEEPGEPREERKNLPPAEEDQAAQEAEEKANEEFARKASNLILKKLRKDLDRGEVDQKLLDELGWTKEDMERFVQRLEQQLQETPDSADTPEAAARRRQFEETLKTLGLSAKTKKRSSAVGKTTRVNEVGTRKVEPPPEYKELFEEYTKELAKPATKSK